MRTIRVFGVLLLGAVAAVRAQDDKKAAERLSELRAEFTRLSVDTGSPILQNRNQAAQLRVLEEAAKLGLDRAMHWLVELVRSSKYAPLRNGILILLADHFPDDPVVENVFAEHMLPGDPNRARARDYLIRRAIRHGRDDWLQQLFDRGDVEDRFCALAALGQMSSPRTLGLAWQLLRDPAWEPEPTGPVRCGTIATAVQEHEGEEAARLLLLLERDRRFTEGDAHTLRDATRLWNRRDLRDYVDLAALADPDPARRIQAARFLGEAGIEWARAPLRALVEDTSERAEVRAAAAEALGGLTIARGDLARRLAALADSPAPDRVREGAVAGLGRLRVRQAAEALIQLLDGPLADPARAALGRLSGLDVDTDWVRWWVEARHKFPEGT